MERNNGSQKRNGFKIALLLFVGFLALLGISALFYFTVETVAGRMDYCTPVTDVSGRLALFLILYYTAGLCGYLPLPDKMFLHFLPDPIKLWRFQTWREIFTNCMRPYSPAHYRRHLVGQNVSGGVLGQEACPEEQEPLLITRRFSEPTPINPCSSSVQENVRRNVPVSIHRTVPTPENPDTRRSSNESFLSFDSPMGGCIVPMVKGKSDKPPYIPDSDISSLEASPTRKGATKHKRSPNTSPRTADVENELPDYPRIPWGKLRDGDLPKGAKALHRRNLNFEKREIEEFAKRLKLQGESAATSKVDFSTEAGWYADDDADSKRKLRLPRPAFRSAILDRRSRRRSFGIRFEDPQTTLRTAGISEKSYRDRQSEAGAAGRTRSTQDSQNPEREDEEIPECFKDPPSLDLKVERIKSFFTRFDNPTGPGLPGTSESQQAIDPEVGKGHLQDEKNSADLPTHPTPTKLDEKPDDKTSPKEKSPENSGSKREDV